MYFRLVCILVLSSILLFLPSSCKEDKKVKKTTTDSEIKVLASSEYQCSMDCEDGKTYHEEGTCPVCKMKLQAMESEMIKSCGLHEQGECDCNDDACTCDGCPIHG
ncbi:hypothetical protein MTsPCn5_02360 [Croceitalea sp. MTPC5]|uniref:heavy metal-binding domain-containing protein n=1 Tax=Croceitalea sp. MTPC5 TaxID=3056565 RepID=UPI002B3B2D40|nr:hypothetical protein MTsPCn5_02360 [Croceitalea sp. MTPC5]